DDTYVHTTGEKTNPIPIEDTVRRNEFVKHATEKNLPRTFKNGIQRKKVEIEFKEEIEMLYDNFINHKVVLNDESFSNDQWNEDSVKTIILNSLNSVIGDLFPNEVETSFFALGLDSLSATKLRTILQKQFSVIKLPHDVIFEYNTVQSLTHYLTKELSTFRTPQDKNVEDGYETKLQALKNEVNSYIQKYNKIDNFPSVGNVNGINGNMNEKSGETILLTGVTGFLGSFILRDLLKNTNVLKVYCLVRASDENHGWSRLKNSFEQRHLENSLLSKERIIILPSDLGDSKFGQTEKIYSKLVQE
ncbi:7849_t:CDS:2, partial [Dentiscutata heterogama]